MHEFLLKHMFCENRAGLELFDPEENLSIQTKKMASSIWGESDQVRWKYQI